MSPHAPGCLVCEIPRTNSGDLCTTHAEFTIRAGFGEVDACVAHLVKAVRHLSVTQLGHPIVVAVLAPQDSHPKGTP